MVDVQGFELCLPNRRSIHEKEQLPLALINAGLDEFGETKGNAEMWMPFFKIVVHSEFIIEDI